MPPSDKKATLRVHCVFMSNMPDIPAYNYPFLPLFIPFSYESLFFHALCRSFTEFPLCAKTRFVCEIQQTLVVQNTTITQSEKLYL